MAADLDFLQSAVRDVNNNGDFRLSQHAEVLKQSFVICCSATAWQRNKHDGCPSQARPGAVCTRSVQHTVSARWREDPHLGPIWTPKINDVSMYKYL